MNSLQQTVIRVVCVILAAMQLFPPYATYWGEGSKVGNGYGFIFLGLSKYPAATVDVPRLMLQYLFILTIGYLLFWSYKDKNSK